MMLTMRTVFPRMRRGISWWRLPMRSVLTYGSRCWLYLAQPTFGTSRRRYPVSRRVENAALSGCLRAPGGKLSPAPGQAVRSGCPARAGADGLVAAFAASGAIPASGVWRDYPGAGAASGTVRPPRHILPPGLLRQALGAAAISALSRFGTLRRGPNGLLAKAGGRPDSGADGRIAARSARVPGKCRIDYRNGEGGSLCCLYLASADIWDQAAAVPLRPSRRLANR